MFAISAFVVKLLRLIMSNALSVKKGSDGLQLETHGGLVVSMTKKAELTQKTRNRALNFTNKKKCNK